MRPRRLLQLCAFVCLLATLALSQATPPSGDTMSYSSLPTKNYGSYTALFVQAGSVTSNSYMQFNLATLPTGAAGVTKATLRLYVNQVTTAGSFDVYQLDGSWNESTLTYNNAPSLGSSATGGNPVAFTTNSLNQFILIDITSTVQGWVNGSLPNNGIALAMTTSAGAIAFDSKEATLTSHQPELEILLTSTSGGSGVTSWNSRTGAVVPQLGDYSFSLLSGTLEDPQLGGTYMSNPLNFANSGNSYVGTSFAGGTFSGNGAGLTNVPVSAGSPYYIQNGTSQQTGASFNIDGSGTVGGTMTATTAVNTSGSYQIAGSVALAESSDGQSTSLGNSSGTPLAGGANTFVGYGTGASDTATLNTFVGSYSGIANTTGSNNTFLGVAAGQGNTTAAQNTLIGAFAGIAATTGGGNTFVGYDAGGQVTTASNDILVGAGTGLNLNTGSSNIYIGNSVGGTSSAESNTIRIGAQGTDYGQQNATYIAGIIGTSISGGSPVFVNSNGQLGVGASGNSGVTSFNTRTGAVVPALNDYSFSLLSGTLGSSQLSGTYSSAVTLSNANNSFTGNGAGLTNVPVSFGSSYYIQNGTPQQTGASFNIDGSGTVGGTLTGAAGVNTTGTYQIGGITVLSATPDPTGNTYLGVQAGAANPTGSGNSFLGEQAGFSNTSGFYNTYVGGAAGYSATTGSSNVYVGAGAAEFATTADHNTFVGQIAGSHLTTGNYNTGIGYNGGAFNVTGNSNIDIGNSSTSSESNTIRIGTQGTGNGQQNSTYIAGINGSMVSSGQPVYVDSTGKLGTLGGSGGSGVTSWNGRTGAVVPQSGDYSFSLLSGTLGSSQLSGTYSNPIALSNSGNSFVGNGSGLANVPISSGSPYYIQNGTSQQTGASFNVDGSGTAGGTLTGTTAVNTSGSYQLGGVTILNGSSNNLFVGTSSGTNNTTGIQNTFVGASAGTANVSATGDTFLGYGAGNILTTGNHNTFLGAQTGISINNAGNNTFVGYGAGGSITTGGTNVFLGYEAGSNGTTNSNDIYIGNSGGSSAENNVIRIGTQGTSSGEQNAVYIAGITSATVSGGSPVFVSSSGQLGIGASGNSGVTSFNTRTGAVVPASSDYSFSLLSGTLGTSQLSGTYGNAVSLSNSGNTYTGASLSVSGTATATTAVNTAGTYEIGGTPVVSTGGTANSIFLGLNAGQNSTAGNNVFVGYSAGASNTGSFNVAIGYDSGRGGNSAQNNTLVGAQTGYALTTGSDNTAVGYNAATAATSGFGNTLLGTAAGQALTSGSYNTALGYTAGGLTTTGSSNVYIGNVGVAAENNTIRIGTQGTGNSEQDVTYIAGIRGSTASGGINVLVSSTGQLGTTTSSRRFKENILDMGDASSKLFHLRPVTFYYKPQYDDGSHILQYGLIAEEVAKVYPDLVVYDKDGQPETVRYHLLTPMLLNEVQKQQKVVAAQQDVIKTQQQQISTQQQEIEWLQQRLERLEALVSNMAKASGTKPTLAAH